MSGKIEVITSDRPAGQYKSDALIVFVPQNAKLESFRAIDARLNNALSAVIRDEHFQAKVGETILFHTGNATGPSRVVLTGMGKQSNPEILRRCAAAGAITAKKAAASRVAFVLPLDTGIAGEHVAQSVVEGALLGIYRFLKFKTKQEEIEPKKTIETLVILGSKDKNIQKGVRRAQLFSDATKFARDLVNEPANELNPQVLADTAQQVAKERGLRFRVLEKTELEKLGAGAILGVGSGSAVPPRLIELSYLSGRKNARKVALVGKGVTFDSGGLSLKTAKYMETMKSDMAGAAAVLAAMRALPDLKPKMDVIGILCAAENMPSGSAIRPGDVLKAMNGRSIEIINTDAEGRLVLADGLAWAVRQGAKTILDLATLTGACVVGLGPYVAGIMGNNQELVQDVIKAGEDVGESFWQLPIPEEYEYMVKSDIADIKNLAANSEAGAIQGALFLREFVGETRWAHLDIAGPAWYEKDFFHIPKNGSGFGARTLLQYLSRK
jgi:leucyl aminopeptidase